jgi:V-type H+-transporting ATPase subunit a
MTGFFETQIKKQDIRIRELPDDLDISQMAAPSAHEIDVLEENTQTNEQRLNHLLENKEVLERRHAELIELRHVLRETAHFFQIVYKFLVGDADFQARGRADEIRRSTEESDAPLLASAAEEGRADEPPEAYQSSLNIGYVAGVIPRSRAFVFEKILWRTLRGNLYVSLHQGHFLRVDEYDRNR